MIPGICAILFGKAAASYLPLFKRECKSRTSFNKWERGLVSSAFNSQFSKAFGKLVSFSFWLRAYYFNIL
jgi:hypothetical protein